MKRDSGLRQPSRRSGRKHGGTATALQIAGAFAILAVVERRRPLRPRTEPGGRRVARNLAMAGLTALITAALQKPLVDRALGRGGLVARLPLPRPLRFVTGVLLLDYTLWWWHWLNHMVPSLWRFHLVLHVDRDLDVFTGLRFHFGEMGLAALFRAAQVRILGVDRVALQWWQRLLLVSILFHHSDLRLPANIERKLLRFIVTPRMHGIHHSEIEEFTQSNWSSLFTCWDMLHRTFIYDVPQTPIGVPAWRDPEELTLGKLLAIPFRHQRQDWRISSS